MKLLRHGIILATAVIFAAVASQPTLAAGKAGLGSFPGPSISSHPLAVIKAVGLDKENGWELEWHVRTTAAAWANDYYTGVYHGLNFSGINYLVTPVQQRDSDPYRRRQCRLSMANDGAH